MRDTLPMSPEDRARLMLEARAAFDRGDFFLAHERWEDVWRSATGPGRRWLQGMIQLAAGRHHLSRARAAPAARCPARGLLKLGDAPDVIDGVDVIGLRRDGARALEALGK